MVADLQLPLICWFDWEVNCMNAFWQRFDPTGSMIEAIEMQNTYLQDDSNTDIDSTDINDASYDPTTFETLNDWMIFLNRVITRSTPALKS